ncbi:hypothetical protein I6E84_08465 [Psychrobacter sp. SCQQ22]|uniref:DUF6231 family protein n=1 Tax=Psychrobacter sp. SCQQ22 TaxID=2792059 RepID=UPI0018CEA2AF|nr:DUF6231 family protein [Psychrobacter sp. SCQQ22]MBH0086251.1 hypothetical protein [Psychrobacter sp. SCQQ22]
MTKHTARRSDITLPLLIDYVDALLPSLVTQEDTPEMIEQLNDITELLWVVQDKNARMALKTELKEYLSNKDSNNEMEQVEALQIVTLSELTQQQLPERYELACFWLPALSSELLQQYIPLLMRYRDLYAAHLLIALESSISLQAYGFTPFDILNEQPSDISLMDQKNSPVATTATLWQFNLYDYKQLPNWLNADYWANPENWGKHRW